MPDKQLILTADDFGRSAAVNEAVARWHRAGALTQASLMVNEPHAAAAVEIARRNPGLRIGLHLTLCDGLASNGAAMPRSPVWSGLRYAFSPAARAWLGLEIASQFQRFRDLGLPATYWDGHAHLHLHPVVFSIALPLAVRHGFKFTRLVREPGPAALLARIFRRLSEFSAPQLQASGIGFADRVFGLRKTGRMDAAEFERAFAHARGGVTEIYFHPGAEEALPDPGWVAARLR